MDEATVLGILILSCFAGLLGGVVVGGALPRENRAIRIEAGFIAVGALIGAFFVRGFVIPTEVIALASLKLESEIVGAIALRWALLSASFGMIIGVSLSRPLLQGLATLAVAVLVLPVYLIQATTASAGLLMMV